MPVLLDLLDHVLRRVRRYREADPDRASRWGIDSRVDADHLAAQVEGRAARVAAVYRRVDLDEIVVRTLVDVAPERRDDAGRHRAAEPERIADRHHPIANLRFIAVAPADKGQLIPGIDLDQGEVGLFVAPHDLARMPAVVLQN